LRLQAKLPLLLTPLTYIHVGKACTPAISNLPKLFRTHSLATLNKWS
jgi:hypothetical protein